jgi:hypothetical protein
MSPILEINAGDGRTLPGPVRYITCQSGQIIVIDPTTTPATTTTLNTDDVYEGEGKAGLRIADIDGSRVYWESTNEAENRTGPQLQVAPDARPQTDPRGEPIEKVEDTDAEGLVDRTSDHSDDPVPTTVVPNAPQRGDSDSDSPTGGTGPYEDRTVPELKATAEKKGVDLEGATRKEDIIEKLRGE